MQRNYIAFGARGRGVAPSARLSLAADNRHACKRTRRSGRSLRRGRRDAACTMHDRNPWHQQRGRFALRVAR